LETGFLLHGAWSDAEVALYFNRCRSFDLFNHWPYLAGALQQAHQPSAQREAVPSLRCLAPNSFVPPSQEKLPFEVVPLSQKHP